jgi:hypothetical protein
VIGYIDESLRAQVALYVVAACLVAPPDVKEIADELRRVPAGRAHRFHWRNESEAVRRRMLDTICELGLPTYAALYRADHPNWGRRGRVQAIKRLLWEFRAYGPEVHELVIESRGRYGDAEDRKVIGRAQRSGHASQQLIYQFESARNPLLWVPDAIAGAVASSFADGDDRYLKQLGEAAPRILHSDR